MMMLWWKWLISANLISIVISVPLEPGQPGGQWTEDEIDIVRDKVIFLLNYYACRYHISTLLPISEFALDEKFQRNASKFAIFYIGIRKPKVAFSVFHFVVLYIFT